MQCFLTGDHVLTIYPAVAAPLVTAAIIIRLRRTENRQKHSPERRIKRQHKQANHLTRPARVRQIAFLLIG